MTVISLPILNTETQRPTYATGPRSLSSVKLLRISVTDRCNLRCVYCMPDDGVDWLTSNKKDLLSADDIEAVARTAASIGTTHLKLTGGEPTIRPDIIEIVSRLNNIQGITDLSLTTNAIFLDKLAVPLQAAGVHRLTLSCDSLKTDRFAQITHGGKLAEFWRGVEAAEKANFHKIKLNVVVMAGVNDDEVVDFAKLALDRAWTIRFIEFMPLGESVLADLNPDHIILDNNIIKQRISAELGELTPVNPGTEMGIGPAQVYTFPNAAGRIGFISAMSKPFCETCNRLRLTSLGELRSCLFDGGEVDLIPALHPKPDQNQLIQLFEKCVIMKPEEHAFRGNRAMSQIGG